MTTHRRAPLLLLLTRVLCLGLPLAAVGCPATPGSAPLPPAARASSSPLAPALARPAAGPSVVVLLVVDQLPSWTFTRHLASFRGGFARLVKEGVYWPRAEYPYAATITAVGHTALCTGAEPHRSGIVGNGFWDRAARRWVDSASDETRPTTPTHSKDEGASPRFRSLEAVGHGRRVLSMSYKARAAVLMAPSTGAIATWYDSSAIAFVSSTTYAPSRPTWLDALARDRPIEPRLTEPWTMLDATPSRTMPTEPPPAPDKFGLGNKFPHVLAGKAVASGLGAMPLANELLVETALAGLDAMKPELLEISFSSHDLAAHLWGQESAEATDLLFRLDATIGKLLDALDARYGADGWSLVFASDHGAPPSLVRTAGAVRINIGEVEKTIKAAAGDEKAIAAFDERMIYLSEDARAADAVTRGKMLDRVVDSLKKMPGIGFAFRTDSLETNVDCTGLAALETLVCRSLYAGRTGDVYYGPNEHSLVVRHAYDNLTHGTPHEYDRQVPLVVRERGRAPRVVEGERPSPLRVAPTVARLLGAAPPPGAREPSL